MKIINLLIVVVMVIGFASAVKTGIAKEENRVCLTLAEQAEKHPNHYYTQAEKDLCLNN